MRRQLLACVAIGALAGNSITPAFATGPDLATASPIKHVIIVIGENRTFDHVFATYKPVNQGEKVLNLLSEKVVNADGSPGPNYGKALQYSASDTTTYQLTPEKAPYPTLPPALVGGTSTPYACQFLGVTTGTSCVSAENIAAVEKVENGLDSAYYQYLLTGAPDKPTRRPISASATMARMRAICPRVLISSQIHTIPTTPMPRVRCPASCKCSSSSTATPPHRT